MLRIDCKQIVFKKDPKFKYFNSEESSHPLPNSISIQETLKQERINAPLVVQDRRTRKFITGLKMVGKNWHYGDILNGWTKEFLLFWIVSGVVVVYYFSGYYPTNRAEFIREFIRKIKRPEY